MRDVVFMVPSPSGWLALDRDQFEQALRRGDAYLPAAQSNATAPPVTPAELVDADQLQALTGVPASWWMAQAREHRVPHVRIGRRVRFNAAEVTTSDAFRRRAIPDGALARLVTGSTDRSASKK